MLGAAGLDVDDAGSLLDAGVVDSTGILEVIMFVEEAFGIEVPDEDIVPENFDSIDRMTAYIEGKTK